VSVWWGLLVNTIVLKIFSTKSYIDKGASTKAMPGSDFLVSTLWDSLIS